ncbi:MAG: DUF389 domain-containing protein [Chloroflexota bacterium]
MKIISGELPKSPMWRVLVLLPPAAEPGVAWYLGHSLVQAHDGELVAAVLVEPEDTEGLEKARQSLAWVQANGGLPDGRLHPVLVETTLNRKIVVELVEEARIDVLLFQVEDLPEVSAFKLPCAVAAVRGQLAQAAQTPADTPLSRLLVHTPANANVAHCLQLLLPLSPPMEITAIDVAHSPTQAMSATAHLERLLHYVNADERNRPRLLTADSLSQAAPNFDGVVLSTSGLHSLENAVHSSLADEVVEQARKPVVVIDPPHGRWRALSREVDWVLQAIVPRLNSQEKGDIYARIQRGSQPTLDFFVLIVLSAAIAALGLLLNSAAVIIGAMLVAPLMSPIIGVGMAIVLGEASFLRQSLTTALRGMTLAILVGLLSGLARPGQPLTAELLGRVQPSLLDLGVALFSGLAAAYALCRSEAAAALPGVAIAAALVPPLATVGISWATGYTRQGLGALLLFTTNFVAISSAAALVFLSLGFRPAVSQKARRLTQARTFRVALGLLIAITLLLGYTTYSLAQELVWEARIREVTQQRVAEITSATLRELVIQNGLRREEVPVQLEITVRSPQPISHAAVVALQEQIGIDLQRPVALTLTVIRITQLDPLIPPTLTPTPTATNTGTPPPTPTFIPTTTPTPTPTHTPTPTPTHTPTPTPTDTPTPTPTHTPTPTPTVVTAVVTYPYGLNLRAEPGVEGELLALLPEGTVVVLLDGREVVEGQTWQQVQVNGIVGWVLADYLTVG